MSGNDSLTGRAAYNYIQQVGLSCKKSPPVWLLPTIASTISALGQDINQKLSLGTLLVSQQIDMLSVQSSRLGDLWKL